jgi:hypothetical protein
LASEFREHVTCVDMNIGSWNSSFISGLLLLGAAEDFSCPLSLAPHLH